MIGNGEGEVPLAKLERHLNKLPANITVKQMDSLESRLAALGSKVGPAAMPKGPMPNAGEDARRAADGAQALVHLRRNVHLGGKVRLDRAILSISTAHRRTTAVLVIRS